MKKYVCTTICCLTAAILFASSVEINQAAAGAPGTRVALNRISNIDTGDSVVFDLSKATMAGGTVSFPVSILSDDTINSLDFSFKYDHNHLAYDSIHNLTAYIQPLAYYSTVDSTVRFTSFSMQAYANNITLVTVHFTMIASQIDSADLNSIVPYLNGNTCSFKVINPIPSGTKELNEKQFHPLFPNPAHDKVNIEVPEKSSVQILDMEGRDIYFEEAIPAKSQKQIKTGGWIAGMYLVRVFNERFSRVEKLVIE